MRPFELIEAEEKINSAFEAIKTQIKMTGPPPEKRGQMIKSFSSEKNVFAVTGENKHIICETGKGTIFQLVESLPEGGGGGGGGGRGSKKKSMFYKSSFYKSMFYKSAPFTNPCFTKPCFTNPPFTNQCFTNPPFTNPPFTNPCFTNPCFTNPVHVLHIQSTPLHSM